VSLTPAQRTRPAPAASPAAWWGRLEPLAVPVLAVVVALGVALRLWSPSPLWLDEAQSVAFAHLPLSDLHGALKTDGAPPLYYVLLHGWLSLFDLFGAGDNVWAARSLSMLASLAALPLAYLVGRRLGGTGRHGQIALVLFAANPWSVRYAGEARMYSLVVLLVLVGILAMDWLRRSPGAAPVIAVGASTAALLYTHYWSVFLVAAVGLVVVVRGARNAVARPQARRVLIGIVGGGVLFLPWVPTMLYQSKRTGAPWASPPDLGSLGVLPLDWSGGDGPVGRTLALMVVPLLLLAVFGRRHPGDSVVVGARPMGAPARLAVVAGTTLVLALGVSMASGGAVVGRYTAVVVPLILLLLAFGVRTLPPVAGVPVLAALVGLGLLGSLTIATTPHTQAGRVADAINASARPGDLVVYCPDQLAPAVERLLDQPGLDRLTLPRQPDPRVVDWTDYSQAVGAIRPKAIADRIVGYLDSAPDATVWFVLGTGYRTHTKVCPALHNRLVAEIGVPATVLERDGRGYEKASLERFPR
jgi:mannosyltransferase